MNLHFNAYSLTLLTSGAAAFLVGLVLFQRRHPSIFWFALMMHVSAIWAGAYAFELASATEQEMLFWINLEYIGISYLPSIWIMFVIQFIGKKAWLTKRVIALIFLIPTVTLLLVWTNKAHHFHYISTSLDRSGPFPLLAIRPGVWYGIHTVFFYFLMAFGMVLLAGNIKRSDKLYRKQTLIILAGAFVPWITNLVYLLGLRPHHHIDLTPYAFMLTAFIIAVGLMRYSLFDVVPFAREKLIESIREGMVVLDDQNRIIDLNTAVQAFLGNNPSGIIGRKLQDVFPQHITMQHLLLRDTHARVEVTLPTEAGQREYEISSTRLQNRDEFIGTLLVFWDITNRKKTTEILKQQTQELSDLNDLKNRLFSIIAHDLKGPMAGLRGILELAQSNALGEAELKEMLPLISKNVDNTKILLDNLLSWARSQLEGELIRLEVFDLKRVIATNVILFEKRASEKNIKLVDASRAGTTVYADKDMIDLVMRNLIGNAIKFCDHDDIITISAASEEGSVVVSVSDTGVGMEEKIKSTLFQLMSAGVAGTRNEKGTGLGLKLCKDFIEKNHGSIWAESEFEKGSVFSFRLPNRPSQ